MDVKLALVLVIGASVIILTLLNLYPDLSNHAVSNESIAFAANNTYYSLGHKLYLDSAHTPTLTYANGTTAVSNYTYLATSVRIGWNIAAGTYFGHYTYYDESWVGGSDYSWVVVLTMLIMAFAVILKSIGWI